MTTAGPDPTRRQATERLRQENVHGSSTRRASHAASGERRHGSPALWRAGVSTRCALALWRHKDDRRHTEMEITSVFATIEAMEKLIAIGMEAGMTAAVGQIDPLLRASLIQAWIARTR